MNKAMMLGLVVLIAQLYAVNIECPTGPQNNPWFHETMNTVPIDEVSNISILPSDNAFDAAAIAPPSGPYYNGPDQGGNSGPNPLWGNDVLVMAHGIPTFGTVTTDQDELNGDIYVSMLVPHTGDADTVYTYRSTDGGNSWTYFMSQYGASSTGGIKDHEILVGNDGSGAWIYSFVLYDAAGSMGGIWALRLRRDLSQVQWMQVVQSGDTVYNMHVDRNIENPDIIFLTYQTPTTDVRLCRSIDYTTTWTNFAYVSSAGSNQTVAAGGDGYGSVAYQ